MIDINITLNTLKTVCWKIIRLSQTPTMNESCQQTRNLGIVRKPNPKTKEKISVMARKADSSPAYHHSKRLEKATAIFSCKPVNDALMDFAK